MINHAFIYDTFVFNLNCNNDSLVYQQICTSPATCSKPDVYCDDNVAVHYQENELMNQ